MKPHDDLLDMLRRHGATELAEAVDECERGTVGLEVHEWREDLGQAVVSRHNIHADMIEDFESAQIDGLDFIIRP
jgi:hypothetical protein